MTREDLFIFLAVAFVVSRLPVFGVYFRSVYTMFHEDGHALAALVTGGKIKRIDLFADTSGLATTQSRFWLGRVLTSAAGYPFASFMAFVFYYFMTRGQYSVLFYGLAVVVAINLLLWVRNLYGMLWLLTLIGLLGGLYYLADPQYIKYGLLFIGAILLSESIAAAFGIFMLSIRQPSDAGDATSLRSDTFLSARLWGLLFFVQSLWFGKEIMQMFT